MGVTEHILQKSQLLKFTYLLLGYIEEKSCNFCSFCINFYEISHNDRKDIIRTHYHDYFAFFVQKCGF